MVDEDKTNNTSEKTFAEEILELLQNVKTLSNDDKVQLKNMLTEVAQNHEVIETRDITNEELEQSINNGITKLASNDVSPNEVLKAVNDATGMVSDPEVQNNIKNSVPDKLVNKFKSLSTKNKLLLVGGTSAAVITAPLLPVVALVGLVVAVLSLGGIAIGKGAIATGKGAVIAGKGIAHGAHKAGEGIKTAANVVKESAEKVSKAATHSVKNVADTLPGRTTNTEQFLNNVEKVEENKHANVMQESLEKYKFLKKFIVKNSNNTIDQDKVKVLKWAVHEIISHDDAKNLINNIDLLVTKGGSTFGTDKNDKIDDYKKFEKALDSVISKINVNEIAIVFESKLDEIKQEKVDQKANSPLNQAKSKVSSMVKTGKTTWYAGPATDLKNPEVQEQNPDRSKS